MPNRFMHVLLFCFVRFRKRTLFCDPDQFFMFQTIQCLFSYVCTLHHQRLKLYPQLILEGAWGVSAKRSGVNDIDLEIREYGGQYVTH